MSESSVLFLSSADTCLENETVWLTQAQMAELFETDRTSIVRHINNNCKRKDFCPDPILA
ncbi:hypothetical protein [Prevotella sp. ne3005]|uniref:hypothetical protein n=1 Tax=Prevotella sp. ne3005 TaxID=1761887 RepID=UPI000B8797B9|nr:hypothetical protein [Prevotella sp. ne3005]